MARYKWLLDPAYIIPLALGIQGIMWLLYRPEESLDTAQPKYSGSDSILIYLGLCLVLLLGVQLGKFWARSTPARSGKVRSSAGLRLRPVILWSSISVSMAALLWLLRPLMANPGQLAAIFTPLGIFRLAASLKESSFGGLQSVACLANLPIALLAQLRIAQGGKAARTATWVLVAFLIIQVLFATYFAARMALITYIIFVAIARFLHPPPRSIGRQVLLFAIAGILVVYLGALSRTGLQYAHQTGQGLFSAEVQRRILDETLTFYGPGELNSGFIIMTYRPNIETKWSYGTALELIIPAPPPPDTLHTTNVLGTWYYALGPWSCALALMVGGWLGWIYKRATIDTGRVTYATTYYLLSYPGIWMLTRYNYFFWQPFLVPVVVLALFHFAEGMGVTTRRATPSGRK